MLTRAVYGGYLACVPGLVLTILAAGCASSASPRDAAADDAMVGGADSGLTPPAETGDTPSEPARLRVVSSPVAEYAARAADGTLDGSRRLVIEHAGEPAQASWEIRRRIVDAEGRTAAGGRTQHVARLADGSIVLEWEENAAENVEVVFEPPLVILPGVLTPPPGGEPHEQKLVMTVHPLGDRSRIRAKGPATNTIRLADAPSDVRLADGGTRRAWTLTSELIAELGPARVRNVTVQWFGPLDDAHTDKEGVELLAERREETTTVLGIPNRHTIERWARIAE